jgi:pimeloyl-ACP methyl ester carboxylesterase
MDSSQPKRQRGRWRQRIFVTAVLAVLLWLAGSYAVAYRLTHRAAPRYREPVPSVTWGKLEELRLATRDGEELGAWFIAGGAEQPPVLLLHGNGRNRGGCLAQAELLANAGHPVLLVTLRAHGDSSGERNDIGYGARADVVAAVAWLGERCPARPAVVWGQSLGSAAAVFAAEELGARVAGYILECPYQDLRTAVWNRMRFYLPPLLDRVGYAGLLTVAPLVLPELDRISPVQASAGIPPTASVLLLAGGADRRALPAEAEALRQAIGSSAELVVIAGADHGELLRADPPGYRATVLNFLAKCGPASR